MRCGQGVVKRHSIRVGEFRVVQISGITAIDGFGEIHISKWERERGRGNGIKIEKKSKMKRRERKEKRRREGKMKPEGKSRGSKERERRERKSRRRDEMRKMKRWGEEESSQG